jgi:hypothetical protein
VFVIGLQAGALLCIGSILLLDGQAPKNIIHQSGCLQRVPNMKRQAPAVA